VRRYDVRFTAESGHYAAICSIDVVSSFGVRVLSEDVDRNLAAKSKSSQLFLGAVERKLNLLSQATEITELFRAEPRAFVLALCTRFPCVTITLVSPQPSPEVQALDHIDCRSGC
jgi:hypothetical protein